MSRELRNQTKRKTGGDWKEEKCLTHTQADRLYHSSFVFFCYNRQLQIAISIGEAKWCHKYFTETFKQAFGKSAVCIHKLLASRWENNTFAGTNGHHLIYGTHWLNNIAPLFLVAEGTIRIIVQQQENLLYLNMLIWGSSMLHQWPDTACWSVWPYILTCGMPEIWSTLTW